MPELTVSNEKAEMRLDRFLALVLPQFFPPAAAAASVAALCFPMADQLENHHKTIPHALAVGGHNDVLRAAIFGLASVDLPDGFLRNPDISRLVSLPFPSIARLARFKHCAIPSTISYVRS